jgi:hypothetical protein
VVAANRGLDQTGAVAVTAGRQRQQHVARVPALERHVDVRRASRIGPGPLGMLPNCLAHEIAQFLLSHCSTWRLWEIDFVDDADDRRVDWRRFFAKRLTGGSPFEHDQHLFVDTGADTIDRQERRSSRRVVEVERLDEQQLGTFKLSVLLRGDERANDAS